jgi:acyl-[acyl carrier protein]--UDP-N-acetylglucosamine O-acyltransferase
MASVGLIPQDLKFGASGTRLVIGKPQRHPRVRDDSSRHGWWRSG